MFQIRIISYGYSWCVYIYYNYILCTVCETAFLRQMKFKTQFVVTITKHPVIQTQGNG